MRRQLALGLLLAGCTDASLSEIPQPLPFRDDKLRVEGRFCTSTPSERIAPLRVMFIVDASVSMSVTDPPDPVTLETGRQRAVRETWQRLHAPGSVGVRTSIIRFSAQAQAETATDDDGDGISDRFFTDDTARLGTATLRLAQTDRTTNYSRALSEAYTQIRTELELADDESLPLSKYVVVFLSDGLPDDDSNDGRDNAQEAIVTGVNEIRELAEIYRVGEFAFHTAYLSSGDGVLVDRDAQDLLSLMAQTGGGNFRSFAGGESLNFLFIDFQQIQRVFTLKRLALINANSVTSQLQVEALTNLIEASPVTEQGGDDGPVSQRDFVDTDGDALPGCGEPLADTDGDGLADAVERSAGSSLLLPDTDGDGLSDLVEWRFRASGLDALNSEDAGCLQAEQCIDGNSDGFCDCVADADSDGICDCVSNEAEQCADSLGNDCVDADADGFCDCLDLDGDGFCDYPDRDGDGITDCEEVLFGTSQAGPDTDADGLPDLLEVRARGNATEADTELDTDFDRVNNGNEISAGNDSRCDDSALRSLRGRRYTVVSEGLLDGRSCSTFDVSNITLVPTLESTTDVYPGNGWNRVLVYAGEVSFDDPNAFASYRVACVMAYYEPDGNLKLPSSGTVSLTETQFVDLQSFDPEVDCLWPSDSQP